MQQVATNNKNTIVVVNSVGPIIMEAWVNHPNVTAIVSCGATHALTFTNLCRFGADFPVKKLVGILSH